MTKPLEPAADPADYWGARDSVARAAIEAHAREDPATLPLWTVYGPNTTDHPGLYVARLWVSLPSPVAREILLRAATLEEIRELLPPALSRLERAPGDDPVILETWF